MVGVEGDAAKDHPHKDKVILLRPYRKSSKIFVCQAQVLHSTSNQTTYLAFLPCAGLGYYG
jgi:hypothetical protein